MATSPIFTATRRQIGTGLSAGLDALHYMKGLAWDDCDAPIVRELATAICRGTGTNSTEQIARLRAWLIKHVGFLRDPLGKELLHSPEALISKLGTLGYVEADCDDVAMLGAALGMAIGLRARFVLVGRNGGYEHVWADLSSPETDEWFDLDITRPFQAEPDDALFPLMLVVEV